VLFGELICSSEWGYPQVIDPVEIMMIINSVMNNPIYSTGLKPDIEIKRRMTWKTQ